MTAENFRVHYKMGQHLIAFDEDNSSACPNNKLYHCQTMKYPISVAHTSVLVAIVHGLFT